jgi:hypothetical protein
MKHDLSHDHTKGMTTMVAKLTVSLPDKMYLSSDKTDDPVCRSIELDENSTSDDDSSTSDEDDGSSRARSTIDNSHVLLKSSSSSIDRRSSIRSPDSRRVNGSVVFLNVHTRVFDLIEEDDDNRKPESLNGATILDDNDFLDTIRNSAKWRFTDSVSDVETHQSQKEERRKEKFEEKIKGHIIRAEQRKMRDLERDLDRQGKEKKNGFKSKYLKPLWKGFIEASGKSAFIISPMQYQY